MTVEHQSPNLISHPNATEVQGVPIAAGIARPDWVPDGADWVNGLWYFRGSVVLQISALMPPEVRQALLVKEANDREAEARAGLPPGHRRHAGLIYGPDNKVAKDLPGGYIDDGSHRPGYAEKRAARIARIQAAEADKHAAIANLEKATQGWHEAVARSSQASDVLVDA